MSIEYKYLKKKYDILMEKNNKSSLISEENSDEKLI